MDENYGFIIVNKPVGPTSHDIIDRLRRLTGEKRIGHAGTLDPFASGVLLVGIGRAATRQLGELVGLDKKYRAVLRLGAVSDTDDKTGAITANENAARFSAPEIETILKKFTGKQSQTPPMYSAKKIKGKKLYELAREGKTVAREPAAIEIYSLVVTPNTDKHPQKISLSVHCSSGTYIRALARDIGAALGCGAYLEELERTAVGPFILETAIPLPQLNADNWKQSLISAETLLAKI
jgi:tRNA pseudouridine55 synthase